VEAFSTEEEATEFATRLYQKYISLCNNLIYFYGENTIKKILYVFLFTSLLGCTGLSQSVVKTDLEVQSDTLLKERLEQHVYTLASDSFRGRKSGTEYARMAAEYIIKQWAEIGIEPYFDNTYLQPFNRNIIRRGNYQNVVGIIRGNDPVLKKEFIVVGAHYDHVGVNFGKIYNGADDNASGAAMLIELGRELKNYQSNLKRSVILIAFDAEEIGLIGSTHYIFHSQAPVENIKLMISIDMVGWYQASGMVSYVGSGTINGGNEIILDPRIVPEGLNVVTKNFETSIFTGTDTQPFALRRIPTFFVNTGLKSPYHTPKDDAHLIDYNGMTLIAEHLRNVVIKISQDMDFESSGRLAQKHKPRERIDYGISANINFSENYSFGIGFMPQINFGIFAIRPELHYEHIRISHTAETIVTNNITVPLSLVLQTPEYSFLGGDISFGGYYSYRFFGNQGGEIGLTFGWGGIFKPFKIGNTFRLALTDFAQPPNERIRNIISYFTISYLF
jgi:hypothetical protein